MGPRRSACPGLAGAQPLSKGVSPEGAGPYSNQLPKPLWNHFQLHATIWTWGCRGERLTRTRGNGTGLPTAAAPTEAMTRAQAGRGRHGAAPARRHAQRAVLPRAPLAARTPTGPTALPGETPGRFWQQEGARHRTRRAAKDRPGDGVGTGPRREGRGDEWQVRKRILEAQGFSHPHPSLCQGKPLGLFVLKEKTCLQAVLVWRGARLQVRGQSSAGWARAAHGLCPASIGRLNRRAQALPADGLRARNAALPPVTARTTPPALLPLVSSSCVLSLLRPQPQWAPGPPRAPNPPPTAGPGEGSRKASPVQSSSGRSMQAREPRRCR